MLRWSQAACLLAFVATAAPAAAPIAVPGDALPDAVAALAPFDGIQAFGVSDDGATAVAAFPAPDGARRSILRIGHREAKPATVALPGVALALVVTAPGDAAFVVVRETDRKGATRRVALTRVDPAAARVGASVALPAAARALALAPGELAVLVAAKDEIRSFLLPDLTSGPLYRVLGDNVAVAPLAGTTRALVGQGTRVVVVDLAATQDRNGLPTIESADTSAPVSEIVSGPDEPTGLARLEDGTTLAVETDPIRLIPRTPSLAIAWPGVKSQAGPAPPPADAPPPVVPEPETTAPAMAPAAAPAVVAEDAPAPAPPPAPAADAPPPEPVAAAPQPAVSDEPGAVTGVLSGEAHSAVGAVLLLGPDNVLREAARVVPDAAGRYRFTGLKTGTYRIVAAGEAGRVLVCQPPYLSVSVVPGATLEAPALDVVRAY